LNGSDELVKVRPSVLLVVVVVVVRGAMRPTDALPELTHLVLKRQEECF
jgi:hypothetical protein